MRTRSFVIGLLLGAAQLAAGELDAGWQALADFRTDDALEIFTQAEKSGDAATVRAAKFGYGVTLLDKQPITENQVEAARGIFSELVAVETDEAAQGAQFYLARIAQHHAAKPDPAKAAQLYGDLIKRWPDSVWAQTALSRLALLEIYTLHQDESPARRIARAEALVAAARVPAAQSELHQVIASAIFHYRLPAVDALPHLLVVAQHDLVDTVTRPDVLVQIGELSRLAGNPEQARIYYDKFLKEYPRDQRHYMVRQKLAELD